MIAGAGSGKTRVLTYKIVHLLAHGYEPYRIMALTFTNKAAREMKERITSVVGQKLSSRLWMGTFHSIFLRILRAHADLLGFNKTFTIYDTSDSKSLIKSTIAKLRLASNSKFSAKEYIKNITITVKYDFLSSSINPPIPLYNKYINSTQVNNPSTQIIYIYELSKGFKDLTIEL